MNIPFLTKHADAVPSEASPFVSLQREEKQDENRDLAERSDGAFTRAIELPEGVEADDVKATMAKGVLTVTVPKPAQQAKPEAKKIAIAASA